MLKGMLKGMRCVIRVGDGRDLTPFERDFLAALEERKVGALVSSPATPGGTSPKLVVSLVEWGNFWVKDYSARGNPSRIFDAQGRLVAEANSAAELVGRFYDRLLARLEERKREMLEAAASLGLRAEMEFSALDESDR